VSHQKKRKVTLSHFIGVFEQLLSMRDHPAQCFS